MAGFGEGFSQGYALSKASREKKKDREQDAARLALDATRHKELTDLQKAQHAEDLAARATETAANREFQTNQAEAEGTRLTKRQEAALAADAAREGVRQKGENERATMASLTNQANSFQRFLASQKPDMVTIEQPLDPNNPNAGKTTRRVRADSLNQPQPPPQETTPSPYAKDIGDTEADTAKQNIEIAGGDKRTGFANWQNRADVVADNNKKVHRLKALELQDQVAQGYLTREQAAEKAKRLLALYGPVDGTEEKPATAPAGFAIPGI